MTPNTESRHVPAEYVSLFEGNMDRLKEDRDSRLDPYRTVLTGINQLLVDVADYIEEKRTSQTQPTRQIVFRLM